MIHLGTAWYPEHWPEERWHRDLELMRDAGMTVVRVAEFAWSSMEKSEGDIDLGWLQRAVDLAAEYGLQTVMCTPTPTPPSWLTRALPDMLPKRKPGSDDVHLHGQRGHYDPANVEYRRHCRRIVQALADQFGQDPNVIGWQTDNEFWTIATNDATMQAFRQWLQDKYGSLEQLNETWSTAFWSQTYFAWDDVQPPLDYPNPALYLDWYQFHGWLLNDFQKEQIDIIRQTCAKQQWVTHNFHPFDEVDRVTLSEHLDFVSWDAYVTGDQLALDVAANALDAETLRGIQQKNIWIMETLPGFVNWRPVNRYFEPGETRAMAWSQIGHGADAILYWQWRSAPACQEQYHGCLLQQDGEPRPVYHEVAQLGKDLLRVRDLLAETNPQSDIAIVNRWNDRQVLKKQPHHQDYEPRARVADVYRAWQRAGYAPQALAHIDVKNDGENSAALPWKMIVAPHLHLLSDAEADRLRQYIEAGGHLVLGPRSGMKDEYSRLRPSLQPGPLADLLGAEVAEFYSLPSEQTVEWNDGHAVGTAITFAELLRVRADDCQVLARFGAGATSWLRDQPAVVTRAVGAGRITYFACCGDAAFHRRLLFALTDHTALQPIIPELDERLEVTRRVGSDDQAAVVLVNFSGDAVQQALPQAWIDQLTEVTQATAAVSLGPYEVAVLKQAVV